MRIDDEDREKEIKMAIANRKQIFPCDVKTIWDIVTDNRNYSWRSDLDRIEMTDDDNRFIEYTKDGFATIFTITEKEPYTRYEFNIESEFLSGSWIGLFKESPEGTELDFTEEIRARGLSRRIMLPFYLKYQQKKYMEDLLKALKN